MKKFRFLATILVVVTGLIMTSNALASSKTATAASTTSTTGDLYRFIPNGIDPINDVHATQQVVAYAKKNPAYGQALASQTGDTSFASTAFKADGYRPHAPAGSTNSAAGAGGQVVGVADHGGSQSVKVVAIINIHTLKVAYVMVRCGNLRLLHVTPIPWKPIHLGVSSTINKMVAKKATITCPSGQKVTGNVSTRVKGVIYARTRGKVKGWAKIWLRQQADLQITTTLKLRCGPAPQTPPASTPPASCTAYNSPGATVCSSVTYINICGIQVAYTGSPSDMQNFISNYIAENCPASTPPSGCTSNCSSTPPCNCTPPPPAAQPPSCSNVTSPENGPGGIEADGTAYAGHVTVNAKNGDSITVTFSALFGSFLVGSTTFTSNGSDSIPWSYKAPSDSSAVGKSDVITVTVHDNTTGLTGSSCSSQPFVINASTSQV